MTLDRTTIKLLFFALFSVALVLTIYFMNRRLVKETFSDGLPGLGKAVPPIGCMDTIQKAMMSGEERSAIVPESGFCDKKDKCCNFFVDFFEPDTAIMMILEGSKSTGKKPYDIIAHLMMNPQGNKKDPETGALIPKSPTEAYPFWKTIRRMQSLKIPTNIYEEKEIKRAAKGLVR